MCTAHVLPHDSLRVVAWQIILYSSLAPLLSFFGGFDVGSSAAVTAVHEQHHSLSKKTPCLGKQQRPLNLPQLFHIWHLFLKVKLISFCFKRQLLKKLVPVCSQNQKENNQRTFSRDQDKKKVTNLPSMKEAMQATISSLELL